MLILKLWRKARYPQFGYMQNIDDLLMQFTIGRFTKFGKSVQFGNALWLCVSYNSKDVAS
jgi:hypothetical protein